MARGDHSQAQERAGIGLLFHGEVEALGELVVPVEFYRAMGGGNIEDSDVAIGDSGGREVGAGEGLHKGIVDVPFDGNLASSFGILNAVGYVEDLAGVEEFIGLGSNSEVRIDTAGGLGEGDSIVGRTFVKGIPVWRGGDREDGGIRSIIDEALQGGEAATGASIVDDAHT